MHNSKNHSKESHLGRIFDLGIHEWATILIWGYAEGYSFDLGVRQYQKVENPCSIMFYKITILLLYRMDDK